MPEGEGTPTGEAFGLDAPLSEEMVESLADPAASAPEEPPPSTEAPPVETPEEPVEGTPEGTDPEAPEAEPAGETPPVEGQPEGQEEVLLAGRYRSLPELEEGYTNIQRMQTRTAQELRQERAARAQMEGYLRQVAPLLQQFRAQQQGTPAAGGAPQTDLDPEIVQVVEPLVQRRVAEQMATVNQQLAAQHAEAEQTRAAQSANAEIGAFFVAHPEIERNSPADEAVGAVVEEFGMELTSEWFEIAHEVATDPELYRVVRANPAYLDTDEGLDLARRLAAVPRITQGAQGAAASAQATQDAARRQAAIKGAHVETGGSGAPAAPASRPRDEVDEVLALAKNDSKSLFMQ